MALSEFESLTFIDSTASYGKTYRSGRHEADAHVYGPCDIYAYLHLPGQEAVQIGTLMTISISSYTDRFPVTNQSHIGPVGFTQSARTIGGTLVFATFDRDAFDSYTRRYSEFAGMEDLDADELPPFKIAIIMLNEYGNATVMTIDGIEILTEAGMYGGDQLQLMVSYEYMARSLSDPMFPAEPPSAPITTRRLGGNPPPSTETTTSTTTTTTTTTTSTTTTSTTTSTTTTSTTTTSTTTTSTTTTTTTSTTTTSTTTTSTTSTTTTTTTTTSTTTSTTSTSTTTTTTTTTSTTSTTSTTTTTTTTTSTTTTTTSTTTTTTTSTTTAPPMTTSSTTSTSTTTTTTSTTTTGSGTVTQVTTTGTP